MDRDEICDKFIDQLPFDPYPFQEEALLAWFEVEGGLLVSAPTGMGKTLIAEAAIFEALHSGKRFYYTTPLIALTEQKFREFQDRAEAWGFAREDVGLITGNRRENPNAPVRVVVAEILLNHLLSDEGELNDVSAVVMDEFHSFNDPERGVVWELSLVLLPPRVRLMLLSATVGNAVDFLGWLRDKHDRRLQLVQSNERRVPLEYIWVDNKLLTEYLPGMVAELNADNRAPALVFCFNRDECWDVAERLKGVKLIDQATRVEVEKHIRPEDFADGAGPKLRQMLIRGVGVHHAGVLPKHKEIVELLFIKKLTPFVVCTETLAAGVNLPARAVVLSTLLKGKPRERKVVPASGAHQMFGRAGRPQFDTHGYVYAFAHEDDIKIAKWRKRYEQIDPNSKDPGLLRARKDLERKKPRRRKTEQYWSEGQFKTLIAAGPANLYSRSMIPYQVLIYLLTQTGGLREVRDFLSRRFNTPDRVEKFQNQLDHMLENLVKFGYLSLLEDGERVELHESIEALRGFRSIDPLYGAFLVEHLGRANAQEKLLAIESVLPVPGAIERRLRLPDHLEPGPLQTTYLEPKLIEMGLVVAHSEGGLRRPDQEEDVDYWEDAEDRKPILNLPDMLKMLFDAKLASPEDVWVQAKWLAGGVFEMDFEFYKFARARNLIKNEGLLLRHLLRLVILAGEFHEKSGGDPEYEQIGASATRACHAVDPRYTDHFLASEEEARSGAVL